MKLHTLAAIGLATLVVVAGAAAAMPGNAPDHANDDAAADHRPDHAGGADDARDDDRDDGDETATDDRDDADGNESEDGMTDDDHEEEADGNESEDGVGDERSAAGRPAHVGPPADLPAQVPDHVATIHDLIRQFLGGDLDGSPGEAISDVTPDDGAQRGADA